MADMDQVTMSLLLAALAGAAVGVLVTWLVARANQRAGQASDEATLARLRSDESQARSDAAAARA